MQRGLIYGLAILFLCCFSDSRAEKVEEAIQLLIEKLKMDLKEDSSNIYKDEISNLRDDVSNLRGDVSNLRDDMSNLRDDMSNLRDGGQSDVRDNVFEVMKQLKERTYFNNTKNDTDPKDDFPVFSDGCNKSVTMLLTIQDQLKTLRQNYSKDGSSRSESHPIDFGGNCSKIFGTDSLKEDIEIVKEQMRKLVDTCKAGPDEKITEEPCNNATLPKSEDCIGKSDDVHIIITKSGNPFLARCEAGWLIIAHRYNGSVDFNLDWDDYKHGFGNIRKEHLIGMENIFSVLQNKKYKARFDLISWEDEKRYAEYQTFDINDEQDKYRLNIGGYSGTAGDSMKSSNHMRFTTGDSDNDNNNSGNCALSYGGPFWYDNCNGVQGSIFGVYSRSPRCSKPWGCLTWDAWPEKRPGVDHNYLYSFKEVMIKIRPIEIEPLK
ncbi:unnamed protein product [Owenia fusiformis]|uniref:Uncharacterized protein n=1 Tax=Owenia fusiformis TaxID=6347 RepID=A0A8J1Y1P6_OWEFU|nr:unnamed protein product [Owenia fusiformis]